MGITRDSIKPGDRIKARCHPLRDGSRGCLLGFVKTRDGSVKDWDGGATTDQLPSRMTRHEAMSKVASPIVRLV